MRDMLIEFLNNYEKEWRVDFPVTTEDLADDLLDYGVIVPPCKVGDTVYCIRYNSKRTPFIKPLTVLSITTFGASRFAVFTTRDDFLGETAFVTEEEAIKALEERSKT